MAVKAANPHEVEDIMESMGDVEDMRDGRPLPGAPQSKDLSVIEQVRNDADIVTVWDRRTGVSSRVKVYEGNRTLEKLLAKVDTDTQSPYYGRKVFTTRSPEQEPGRFYGRLVPGSIPCILHPTHPRFGEFQAMGFTSCKRGDFKTQKDALDHARVAHVKAWAAGKEAEERHEKDVARAETRETNEAIRAAVEAMAAATRTPAPNAAELVMNEPPKKAAKE